MAKLCIVGACHTDTTCKLNGPTHHGRTNPGNSSTLPGGVAANIARYICQNRDDMKIIFVGAAATENDDVASELSDAGIDVTFARLDGSHPTYNAILDHNGELIIGVADMARAILNERPHRASGALACHILEVMHAFDQSSESGRVIEIESRPERPAALPAGLAQGKLD